MLSLWAWATTPGAGKGAQGLSEVSLLLLRDHEQLFPARPNEPVMLFLALLPQANRTSWVEKAAAAGQHKDLA